MKNTFSHLPHIPYTEYCGAREHHEYELYLALEDIDHSKTKAKSPQTNGICERLHRTMQEEFYAVTFRKKPPLLKTSPSPFKGAG